jgi:hypothetical protein
MEANMSILKRLRSQIVRFAKTLEGIDDPAGDYMFFLGKRLERLERAVEHLERELHSPAGVSRIQQ